MRTKHVLLSTFCAMAILGCIADTLWAKPTTSLQAKKAVEGWLKADAQPLGAALGHTPKKIDVFSDEQGQVIYYIVYLQPAGFVIVPADDTIEPILGFADHGTYDPSPDNPLGALVNGDVKGRISAGRNILTAQGTDIKAVSATTSKWERLIADSQQPEEIGILGLTNISDHRVDPLLRTKWSQTTCCETPRRACYNYYTPPSDPCDPTDSLIVSLHGGPIPYYGDPNNFPCGCVATAMAQLMRFHTYPTAGIGKVQRQIRVNGILEQAWTRGGNGNGGAYAWNSMVFEPNCNTTLAQRQAIGALCYDAGVSVNMNYFPLPNGSSALLTSTKSALKNTFTYSNAFYQTNGGNALLVENLKKMINPNLDYEHPVLISIQPGPPGVSGGHAVAVDGYGYNSGTMYHHINMGWAGVQDAWYNFYSDMPPDYTYVDCCVYNIFVTGTGEIISGCVTDASGNALAGETVTAVRTGGGTYQTTTNNRGIYALAHVLSASTYTISVTKPGYNFGSRVVSTLTSVDNGNIGNVWAVDFSPFGISAIFVDANATGSNNGSNWTDAYKYLRDAISAASSGKIILVAEGTYNPDADSANPGGDGDRFKSFKLKNGVALYGGFPSGGCNSWADRDPDAHPSILSGDLAGNDVDVNYPYQFENEPTRAENSIHVVDGNNTNVTAILDGFTITAGDANGNCQVLPFEYDEGGGMINIDANCVVKNCTFLGNFAVVGGGGMWNGRCNLNISNCTFLRNGSHDGGGMRNNDVNSHVTITNCTFTGNWGAWWVSDMGYWTGSGGGMLNNGAWPTITNCVFSCNTGGQYGGGMVNYNDSGVKLINCTFSSNLAELNGWLAYGGGGIYNYSLNYTPNYIINCIFWDNRDASGTTESAQIKNWYSSCVGVLYSCIQDDDPNDGYIPFGGAANHNIDDNPLFVRDPYDGGDNRWGNANDDYGNLHLAAGSPCIDDGNNTAVPADTADLDNDTNTTEQTPLDLDLRARFVDGDSNSTAIVDMGAYEFSWVFAGDFDGDFDVDFTDFAILAASWLQNNPALDIAPPPAGDGIIDFNDFAVLFDYWLAGH